jgi:hypothetical protein
MAKNTSTEQMTKLAVVMTELVAREFPDVQKITALVDLKGLSLRTNVDLAMFQELIRCAKGKPRLAKSKLI